MPKCGRRHGSSGTLGAAGQVAPAGDGPVKVDLVDHLVCPRCGPPFGLVLLAHDVRDRRVRRGEFGCPNCRDRFPVEDGFGDLRPPPRRELPGQPVESAESGPGAEGVAEPTPLDGGGVAKGGAGVLVDADGTGRGRPGDPEGRGGGVIENEGVDGGAEWAGGGRPGDRESGGRGSGGGGESDGGVVALAAALGVANGTGLVVLPDSHRDAAVALARRLPGLEVLVVGWRGRGRAGSSRGVSAFVTGPALPLRDGAVRGVVVGGGGGEGWWAECLRVLMPGGRLVFPGPSEESRLWIRAVGLAAIVDEPDWLVAVRAAPGTGPRIGRWGTP